ncbi:phosphoglycerate dehydrogenase, partial [Candidatus Gottesmanbacteria bacterium]|nr:phosphoglycerate dehydrogenase [Candidatus Gottesmanbacteria bacterium]
SDRRTKQGKYKMEMGTELKGKTLGVIGLGNIGGRVAELGKAIGMKVIAYNRTPKTMERVEMKTLDEVLQQSDVISLHTTHEDANKEMIGSSQLGKVKNKVIIVNTVDRELVDEKAMAEVIKSGKVSCYAYEAEDLVNTPLAGLENVIDIQGFGWYTKEALENLYQIWTNNIAALAKGTPQNLVVK